MQGKVYFGLVKKRTSPNRTVNVRRLKAARLRKIAVGLTPFVQFSLRQSFLCPKNATHFPHRAQKTFVYSRDVK